MLLTSDAGASTFTLAPNCSSQIFIALGLAITVNIVLPVRVALMPSKDEVIETEVIGAVDPDAMMAAIDVASAGCRDLTQAVRNYLSKCVQ